MKAFEPDEFFPPEFYSRITGVRVDRPGVIMEQAALRRRRKTLSRDGRLVVVAADHPGRLVVKAGGDPWAMADRRHYLARILRVLTQPGIDGILATPDILEELLIVEHLLREDGLHPLLDDKVLIGSMNRGGLAGAAFEMRDRFTSFSARQLKKMGLDGGKMLLRVDLTSADCGATLWECAQALRELEELDLPAFLEPLPVESSAGGYSVRKTAEDLIPLICAATALGDSTRLLWLKIPRVEGFQRVCRATTCPILMLGGEARDRPEGVLEDFAAGLRAGDNVRGVLVGRNILFPGESDPASMASAIGALVHEGASPRQARERLGAAAALSPLGE
jgi:DhnA family fructose-bisphosphate aldolase class Ia